jgi:DNA primase
VARITTAELERLNTEVSLERLALAKGVKLERRGQNLVGLCPFCASETPTLRITPKTNRWRCEGACKKGGRVVDWVMKAEGLSRRHAVELLRADFVSFEAFPQTKQGRQTEPVAKKTTTTKLAPIEHTADEHVLMASVFDYYNETLKQSPEALGYLEKRGLRSQEMVERFRLGFANRTLAYRLPQKNRQAGAEVRGKLQALGILRESGHEHFNGSLVIPVVDAENRVVHAYGRKITSGLRKGTPLHLYLPGPYRGVWNREALTSSRQVILCESLIDALTFWCAGFRNVTAAYGVDGLTDDYLAVFAEVGIEQVMIAFGRDADGDRGAKKVAATLTDAGFECFRVVFPAGMDANDYWVKRSPGTDGLEKLLRQATWLGKGKAKPAVVMPAVTVESASTSSPAVVLEDEPVEPESVSEVPAMLTAAVEPQATSVTPIVPVTEPATEHARPTVEHKPVTTTHRDDEVVLQLGDRTWRVRGLGKNTAFEVMRVNVLCSREGAGFHVDSLELYSARQRAQYAAMAAHELCVEEQVIKRDLGAVLLKLEELQDQKLRQKDDDKSTRPELSDEERAAAMELLRDPRLLDRILDDFERCGVVGETTNKLVGYLAATSRLLDEPLAVIIQSCSAAGKSSLMDAVLALMPEEDRVQYSAMTGQSLFYLGETDLQHKILTIVEEEGAERATYALKLLQSEGELTIASTGKDAATGRLVTQEYRVRGPVMIFLTTTAIEIDEELLNRCLVLSVDEGRAQTQAIHHSQRAAHTLEGVLAKRDKDHVVKLHRDAQRLLRPVLVVNPFAHELTFLDHATRTRRDHVKYLTLIRTIALLHQHQRPMKTVDHRGQRLEYIEVARDDIVVANRLCHEVLGRSLDELPPQTRKLLKLLDGMVKAECHRMAMTRTDYRFSRRDVREHTGWGNTQLKVHLARLAELEYVLVHRGRQGQGYVYEVAYDGQGQDGTPFLPGLLDATTTGTSRTAGETSREADHHFTDGGRASDGPETDGGRIEDSADKPAEPGDKLGVWATTTTRSRTGTSGKNASHAAEEATG